MKYEKILPILSDGAAYTKKSYNETLRGLYRKCYILLVLHICYIMLQKQLEAVFRKLFRRSNNLSKKSPIRIQVFNNKYPNLPLPPDQVVTRWGTWLKAVNYIAENHEPLFDVNNCFGNDENSAIPLAKAGLENPTIIRQIYGINKNFAVVLEAICEIEKSNQLFKLLIC